MNRNIALRSTVKLQEEVFNFLGLNNVEIFSHVLWQGEQVAIMTYLRKPHEQFQTVYEHSRAHTKIGTGSQCVTLLSNPFQKPGF